MSLFKLIGEIFDPHIGKIKDCLVNEILEDMADIIFDELVRRPQSTKEEIINRVKMHFYENEI